MSTLIGICARGAQSGKDSASDYLVEKYGFTKVPLADPVRESLLAINPIIQVPREQSTDLDLIRYSEEAWLGATPYIYLRLAFIVYVVGWDKAKQIVDVREQLQRLGTEAGRDTHGIDCWTKIAQSKLKGLDKAVISDVRFDDEASFVHSNQLFDNKFVVQMSKPGVTSLNDHASEVPLPSECWDIQIFNDGTLEDLYAQIDEKIGRYLV